jgi:hydrogenase maturation protease
VILIISYGNSLRRDDGAGLILAEQLEDHLKGQGRKVKRISVHQLTPELAMEVADESVQAVVFADTRVVDPRAGSFDLQVQSVQNLPGPASLGHQLSPGAVLAYASLLYHHYPPAWLLTVPGVDFAHGEGVSEVAERAMATLPDLLATLPPGWPLIKDFP